MKNAKEEKKEEKKRGRPPKKNLDPILDLLQKTKREVLKVPGLSDEQKKEIKKVFSSQEKEEPRIAAFVGNLAQDKNNDAIMLLIKKKKSAVVYSTGDWDDTLLEAQENFLRALITGEG